MTIRDPLPAESARGRYQFGDVVLDLEGGFLRRSGEEVPLRRKAFEVLTYLVLHHQQLVSKDELAQAVWPDTAVTDNSLSQCLSEIRRALADEGQAAIRTVARRGYVFDAPVTVVIEERRTDPTVASRLPGTADTAPVRRRSLWWKGAAAFVLAVTVAGAGWFLTRSPRPPALTFIPLTDFTDSAVSPAVSPDGRMLAFIRSSSAFLSPDQIWVKLLPNGEPVQVTNIVGNKYGPAFSSDGSRIAFTLAWPNPGWNTLTVPALGGGASRVLLSNAAGLTWIDRDHVLFSKVESGMHMGIATASADRAGERAVYFPEQQRAMAHYSALSPDHRWVLIVEMSDIAAWLPCRLVPFDGSSRGRQVGPSGGCTGAAWSPDGRWMYFSAEVEGQRHLWRQRVSNGRPEQITFGPNEEDGVAVFPDGSLATSVGVTRSAVWLRDGIGEHPVTSEGTASMTVAQGMSSRPQFSRDGRYLYYLLRRNSPGSSTELWRYELGTARREAVLTGFDITDYDIDSDGGQVVFSARPKGRGSEIWLASLDRDLAPRLISVSGDGSPHFGPDDDIVFRLAEGGANYIARMKRDGSHRRKVAPYAISTFLGITPDRDWVVVYAPKPGPRGGEMNTFAAPVEGGPARPICAGFCVPQWAPDGRFLYLRKDSPSRTDVPTTLVVPLERGDMLPALPPDGLSPSTPVEAIPGAHLIEGEAWTSDYRVAGFSPSSDPATLAYVRVDTHHNIFQVSLH